MQRKYQKKFDANTKRTRWQITLIKSDRVQAAGGSLEYINAPSQTLASKEKGGRIEKELAQKRANKIGGKVNV